MTVFVLMILIGLNFVAFPCQGKIIQPPGGNSLIIAPGTNVKIEWSFDDVIKYGDSRFWYFKSSDGKRKEVIARIIDDKDAEIFDKLPDHEVEIIKPATLVLKNVDLRYNGTYVFSLGTARTTLSSVMVIVAVKPIVTVNCSTSITVDEDDDVRCLCKGEGGDPPANVTWYKNGVQYGGSGDEENMLTLSNIDRTASGTYRCVAQSYTLMNETTIEIIVYYAIPPTMTSVTFTPETTMLGKTVVITCEAIAVPVPSYIIIHNDSVVVSAKKTYIIPVLNFIDAGSYKCIARNILGNSSKTFCLSVIGPDQTKTKAMPTINSQSNEVESGNVALWHVVVALLSGIVIGFLLACIMVTVCYRRRYRKKKPAEPNPEPQSSNKADSIYQDLDLNKMNEDENYQSLRAVNSDDKGGQPESDYTELNLAKDVEDNYESLTST